MEQQWEPERAQVEEVWPKKDQFDVPELHYKTKSTQKNINNMFINSMRKTFKLVGRDKIMFYFISVAIMLLCVFMNVSILGFQGINYKILANNLNYTSSYNDEQFWNIFPLSFFH